MRFRSLCIVTLLVFLGAEPVENTGTPVDIELLVRGPDARPLVQKGVVVRRPDELRDPTNKIEPISVVTDAQGIAHFQVPAGTWEMTIAAPGVGYGNVAATEYVAGQVAKPQSPPLAPYGSISGTIAPAALAPGAKIVAGRPYSMEEESFTAEADAQGHFTIKDAPAGLWYVWAAVGTKRCADGRRQYTLAPGQALAGVKLEKLPPEVVENMSHGIRPAPMPGEKQQVVWVRGTIRDEAGQPMPDVDVFALATYYGGIRMYEETSRTKTDAKGHYEVRGPGGQAEFSLTLLAHAAGKPPVWDWPHVPSSSPQWVADDAPPKGAPPPLPPANDDLVVPSRGGGLSVTVIHDGKPAAGVRVAAYLEHANLRDIWAAGHGTDHNVMNDVAHPTAVSDGEGVAHFENLLPGRYRVSASMGDATAFRRQVENPWMGAPGDVARGACDGIAVSLGQTSNLKLAIYPQPNISKFRLLRADGSPLNEAIAFGYGPVGSVRQVQNLTPVAGDASMTFLEPGLWHFEAMFRQTPLKSYPFPPPCSGCIATVAVSPNLGETYLPTVTARHIDAASVRITVKDAAGKPLQVPVELDRPLGDPVYSASTDDTSTTSDADGNFTLAGLTPGSYSVQAALDNIWLSAATTVRIADADPPPIVLDVGAPGAAVLVHLQDAAGKPAVGRSLTIDRPSGPLVDALWPAQWRSDGAGLIYIPTLEAGAQVLHVTAAPTATPVQVPALPATKPVEATVTVPH